MKKNRLKTIVLVPFIFALSCNYVSGSEKPPGDIHKFKPVIYLSKIAKYSGKEAKLVSIKTDYVLNNGTMDLDPGYTNVATYEFLISAKDEEDLVDNSAHPPGMDPKSNKYGWSSVTVQNENNVDYSDYENRRIFTDRGMRRVLRQFDGDPNSYVIQNPNCNFKEIWKKAIKAGAPKKYSASITYDKKGYEFSLQGKKLVLKFDTNCSIIPETPRPQRRSRRDNPKRRR